MMQQIQPYVLLIILLLISSFNNSIYAQKAPFDSLLVNKAASYALNEQADSANRVLRQLLLSDTGDTVANEAFYQKAYNLIRVFGKHPFFKKNNQAKYKTNVLFIESVLAQPSSKPTLIVADLYTMLAISYRFLEENQHVFEPYKKAFTIYKSHQSISDLAAFCTKNLSFEYGKRLNYEEALNCLYYIEKSNYKGKHVSSIYNAFLTSFIYQKKYIEALRFYQKGIKLSKNEKDSILLKSSIAPLLNQLGRQEEALSFIKESINYYEKENEVNKLYQAYNSAGEIYESINDLANAEKYFLLSLKTVKEDALPGSRTRAKVHVRLGDFYERSGKNMLAIDYFQEALQEVFPNFKPQDLLENPNPQDVYTESWIMTAAERKANWLIKEYKENQTIEYLKAAAACYQLSMAAVTQIKQQYNSDEAKQYLADYNYQNLEKAINNLYNLYTQTKDETYIEEAFGIIEQSKAYILMDAFNDNRAKILAQIPEETLNREQQLKKRKIDLELSLNIEKSGQGRIDSLEQELNEINLSQNLLADSLKEMNPQYAFFLQNKTPISLTEVREKIANNELLMAYFWGEEHIYAISIHPQTSRFTNIPKDSLFQKKNAQFLVDIQSPTPDAAAYQERAHYLYQALIEPHLNEQTQSLLLIPDGGLNLIPFEALIREIKKNTLPKKFDYLLQHFHIKYAYSASLLLQPIDAIPTTKNKKQLAIFAPGFYDGARQKIALKHTNQEIKSIKNTFPNTEVFNNQQANVEQFKQVASQYDLLHLSTHAKADSFPHIQFIDTVLYLPELYGMNIAADFVFLSACETGQGVVQKGEGIMSLARGFSYAGVRSLVATLWRVNEAASADIATHFYQYLKQGDTKSEALAKSKKQYINNCESDIQGFPHYWAAYIYAENGQTTTHNNTYKSTYWYYLLLAAMIVGAGAFLFNKKK